MRIVLLLDEGTSYRDIEEKLGAALSTVSRWKQRYEKDGVLGLATIHPGQPPQKLTPQLRARVLERTRQAPPDGSTRFIVVSQRGQCAVDRFGQDFATRINL
jgi:transposase